MLCITIRNKEIVDYASIYELLKMKVDTLFVVDYDAIARGHLNFNVYDKLSKFFEITVMNYPRTESDLTDTIINGASNVVINNNLTYKTIKTFIAITENIAMNYNYNDTCIYFSENGGSMFLSNKEIMLPYKTAYNYGNFDIKNSIKLTNFPDDIMDIKNK